ncbi:interleukin 19 like [Nothobranchius furzeri]|uniref:interleukin 19 like n=1 Tax=Nothobranchius furzeri TaxID=105023 RepID=UPI002403D4D8|nr:interleukin 19 like [Nothobranchius furzeri]
MTRIASSASSLFLILIILGCARGLVRGRTLHADGCSANVHTHELRKYYSDIQLHAISGDTEMGVKLLNKSMLKDVQEGQTCCFLRLLLRFYIERVFINYKSSEPHQQRSSSALANAFVSLRRDMHKCHCSCGEETQRTIDSVSSRFDELQVQQAALKALGELGTVLGWLEELAPNP